MTPLAQFEAVWERCDHLAAIQAYASANAAGVLRPDELLRAEWVARVSALDLYVHRLIADRMVRVFEGTLPQTQAYQSFKVPNEVLHRIQGALTAADASAAFDLEVRRQLGLVSYQHPDNIAAGIRLVSSMELWNDIALHQGATPATKERKAKQLRQQLAAIVDRRNKIAHEGDLQPTLPVTAWPVSQADLAAVRSFIVQLVTSIDACI